MRKLAISIAMLAGSTLAFGLSTSAADAAILPPGGLVNAPEYCEALYGSPDPCPPPDRPDQPECVRVDIRPLRCPWLP
jgi:hypothetical protein